MRQFVTFFSPEKDSMMSAVFSQIYPLFMTITYSGDELFLQLRGDLLDYLYRKLSKDEAADIL